MLCDNIQDGSDLGLTRVAERIGISGRGFSRSLTIGGEGSNLINRLLESAVIGISALRQKARDRLACRRRHTPQPSERRAEAGGRRVARIALILATCGLRHGQTQAVG